MNCPRCKSTKKVKNGIVKGKQRYKCKECGYNFTVEYKSTAKKSYEIRLALILYLEGLGFHSISKLLGISHVSIMNWIKKYSQQIDKIRNDKPVNLMELDELRRLTKTNVGFGLQLVEQTKNTLISLWGIEEPKQE